MLNVYSAAEQVTAWLLTGGSFGDLENALAYAIVLQNQTTDDITSGTMTIETASAQQNNPCEPDTWAPLETIPTCDALPGTVGGPATIELSPEYPIAAMSQCAYAAPCPGQFVRVSGVPAGLNAILVVTRFRRTGGPKIPYQQFSPCLPGYASP